MEHQVVLLLSEFPVMQVDVWLQEEDLPDMIQSEVPAHLLRNESS